MKFYGYCVKIILKIEMWEYCCLKLLLSFYCTDERDHPFSTYANFLEEVMFFAPWYVRVRKEC